MLTKKNVISISGTHGKTTTSYMLCHIFLKQDRDIGYLVGGVSSSTGKSACLGSDNIFIVEADEYDSAFFDKRSKFIHYKTNTLIINNIEFDHADIFRDLDDIKKQFHHLIKTIPGSGNIIFYGDDKNSYDVVTQGAWSKIISINKGNYQLDFKNRLLTIDEKEYSLKDLPLIGEHNLKNYCSAILAANVNGISIENSIESLLDFDGVKRRLENKGSYAGISIYDDFAHHPTAIRMTADALSSQNSESKILGIIELGSNTMSGGFHGDDLFNAPSSLAKTIWIDHKSILGESEDERLVFNSIESSLIFIKDNICDYDIILIMTNKDSSLIYNPIIKHLEKI
jgi:UDP-N-acetylmuramate: L-alanyl-gamma-D-glutamyl-meso-diaminopimelate ligase